MATPKYEPMKIDVIVTWPRNCDYPLWRQMIHDYRDQFNEVIIVFMETNHGEDYRPFVQQAMNEDRVNFIQSPTPQGHEDWRDVAVNTALRYSQNSEWIWFTEQDFFPEPFFFVQVEEYKGFDYIGVTDGPRLHPCSLFIKRDVLNKTKRFFGTKESTYDHFGQVQLDLKNMNANGALLGSNLYRHLAGLSHNMTLLARSEAPNYKPEEFKEYLKDCLNVTVPLDERFKKLALNYVQ